MHNLLHMPLIQWLFYFIFASFGCLDSYKTGLSKPLLCSLTRMVPMDQLHVITAIWWLSGVAAVSVACMRVQWVFLWFQREHVFLLSDGTLFASGAVGASTNAQGNRCIQCLPVSRWPRMTHSIGISMSTNFLAFLSSASRTLMVQVPPSMEVRAARKSRLPFSRWSLGPVRHFLILVLEKPCKQNSASQTGAAANPKIRCLFTFSDA